MGIILNKNSLLIMQSFMQHVADHGLSYGTIEEFNFRANIFAELDEVINAHNSNPNSTSTMGHNFMSTMTYAEKKVRNGFIDSGIVGGVMADLPPANADEVNWNTNGGVTPVKNQGQCGSCWSFSTTGALEGAHFIKHKELLSFSEQQLVDCNKLFNHGCKGGSMALAFRYLETHKPELEKDYPYTSGTTKARGECQDSKHEGYEEVSTFAMVPAKSVDSLKAALAQQPVSVAIEADKAVFQHYTGGVLTGPDCGTALDHGVLAVGYGTENGTPYFIVKNSWGPTWGDKGFIKLGQEEGAGVCGLQSQPVFPTSN